MSKFKKWQDQLLLAVGQGVQKYGFDMRPKGQSFLKNCPFGRVSFHLAFIKHDDDFDVTTDVAIRFDKVEEFISHYRDEPLLRKSEKANISTLGCELGNLSEGRQKRWTIASAEDIPVVAESVLDTFAKVGLPYIEEFADPKRALEVLKGDGRSSWLHSPFDDKRAIRAVTLMLHLNGKELAQQLAKLKLAFLEERKDSGLSAFREFLDKSGLG